MVTQTQRTATAFRALAQAAELVAQDPNAIQVFWQVLAKLRAELKAAGEFGPNLTVIQGGRA